MVYDNDIPPPRTGPPISEIIRGLGIGQSVFLDAESQSVRSIVTRVKQEFNGSRAFMTAKEGDGIRVWRIEPEVSQQGLMHASGENVEPPEPEAAQ